MKTSTLFTHYLHPLFVPEQYRGILTTLENHGFSGMTSELERLAALGSNWAASTLGYLCLLPPVDGVRDPARAIELCSKAAAAGDAYALFITSWAQFLLTNSRVKAAPAMIQSSKQRFSPAVLAMSFFVWPKIEMAFRFVDEASRLRHKAAWAMQCGYLRTGRMGFGRQLWGYVLTPFARLRYKIALFSSPFSENVLVMSLVDPLSRVPRWVLGHQTGTTAGTQQ
jgi:hypothetical protein